MIWNDVRNNDLNFGGFMMTPGLAAEERETLVMHINI